MMWPFRRRGDAQLIRDLRQERDQADDAYTDLVQSKAAAERAMREMQKATTAEGVKEIASKVTKQVADIYAKGCATVDARDVAVHSVVAAAIIKATHGSAMGLMP